METEQTAEQEKVPLRIIAPNVYQALIQSLGDLHLQPYDVKADAVKKDNGLFLIIRYGPDFKHTETHFFSDVALNELRDEVTAFFNRIAEACQEVLVSDYLQAMNPLKQKKR